MKLRHLSTSLAAGALAIATHAEAQDTSPPETGSEASVENDIIVTAQRRSERLQDVPITITSLSSETLERANITDLSGIARVAPAVRFDYQGVFVQPTIRGVGNAVVTTGGGSNVGIYVDGFYSPNPMAGDFQLLNLQNIQVLKGPQGTLFGRNTTGGAILVTSSEPQFEPQGQVRASYGRFDSVQLQGYATTGLTDAIAFDLAASWERGDGYVNNIVAGPDHPGRYRNWSVRTGLKFDLSDRVSFLARYTHQSMNDARQSAYGALLQDGFAYTPQLIVPGPTSGSLVSVPIDSTLVPTGFREAAVNPGDDPTFLFNADVFQLTGKFDFDFADLTSYTQYRDEVGTSYTDLDQSALDLLYTLIPVHDKTFTQELLLTSKPGGRLQWTAGLFYFNYTDTFENDRGPVTGAANKQFDPIYYQIVTHARTQSIAAYVDATYQVADDLYLTAGARYSHDRFDRVTAQFPPAPAYDQPSVTRSRVTPRAVLRYEINPSSSIYASYTNGYKAPLTDVVNGNIVNPETMDAFEVGFKHSAAGLTFNLAAWYYKYKDLQVSIYENGLSRVLNAANAKIYGIEGDVNYKVTRDFEIGASAAWLHAEYNSFPTGAKYNLCSTVQPIEQCAASGFDGYVYTPFDASGGTMQRAPTFTASANASYGFDLGDGRARISGTYYHTSKFYFDLAEQFYEDGYDLVGLRAEWTDPSDRFTAAVYGDNLLNQKYYSQVVARSTGVGTIWGAPATWGLSLTYRYH